MIRLLIVDDQDFFARTVAAIALAHGGIEIVGRAHHGVEAVELASRLRPDVVVMDVEMPRLDGLSATRVLRGLGFGSPILVVSGSDVDTGLDAALAAGANDFVRKTRAAAELVDRLHALVASVEQAAA